MKFQYSPGLLGYGAKGGDGSAGLQGLALYFTDFDPVFDLLRIEDCIRNDYVMWSSTPGVKLPGGRVYQSGDLFVSSRGYIYQIDASEDEFTNTGAALSKSEFFESHVPPIYDTITGFERYSNIHNASTNYLIDNNFSSKSSYLVPGNIYGINLQDFTRIEFTDVSAFTLYSSAEQAFIDEHKALAIFNDKDGFRIGNLENGNIRDTNLTLDVSLLLVNRQDSNRFKTNTPSGTVITNAEKATNILFDPIFEDHPGSFILQPLGEYSRLTWNLEDFTPGYYDPSIKGTIVFNKKQSASGTWAINASIFKPLIIHDVDPSGYVIINDLSIGTTYEYYMILKKDGWQRQSLKIETIQAGSPATMTILDPASKILNANYLGEFTPYESYKGTYIYGVDISTDSFTGWNVNYGLLPSWIDVSGGSGGGPGEFTFDVSLIKHTGTSSRTGYINVLSEASPQIITVNQAPLEVYVAFDSYGKLVFTSSPSATIDVSASVTIQMGAWGAAAGGLTTGRRVHIWVETWRKSGGIWTKQTNVAEANVSSQNTGRDPNFDPNQTGYNLVSNTFTISPLIDTSIYIKSYWREGSYDHPVVQGPSCDYESDRWVQSMGYAYISSVSKISGTGNVQIGTNRYYYWKKYLNTFNSCSTVRGAGSTNTSHPSYFP